MGRSHKQLFFPGTSTLLAPPDPQNNPNTKCLHRECPPEAAILKAWLSPNMAAASDVATFGHMLPNKEYICTCTSVLPNIILTNMDFDFDFDFKLKLIANP